MNKLNYLFDACISHRNIHNLQKDLDNFFEDEEDKFYKEYFSSRDEYEDEGPRIRNVIDSWDDVYKYPSDEWISHSYKRDTHVSLKPRMIHYKGYLYRYMSINEYNKYITHTLEDDNREWSEINRCSDNKGYCFIGQDYKYMNTWDLDMECKYLSLHEKYADGRHNSDYITPIEECISHVGMIHHSSISLGEIGFREHVIMQNVLCKFYYEGEIRQSIGYYGEGFFDEWEDNYMIEYGLPNYNNLVLVDARFSVYETTVYGR